MKCRACGSPDAIAVWEFQPEPLCLHCATWAEGIFIDVLTGAKSNEGRAWLAIRDWMRP